LLIFERKKLAEIFVLTVSFASAYKINVCDAQDVGAKSKDFNNLSGKYTMELIVGDAVIENPITWLMVSK